MKVGQRQFEEELVNQAGRKSNIVIMGMSGSGKTYWSKLLAQRYGYPHIEFDDLIGKSPELADLIGGFPGKDAAEKLGNYFGMPWTNGFDAKEATLLGLERKFMSEAQPTGSILDLTGSCIYHPTEMEAIRATGLVIYLETSLEKQKEMLEIFLAHPKPVCWKGVFERKNNETNENVLSRCYPLLLAHRAKLYQRFADVTLAYAVHKNLKSAEGFVQEVEKRLPPP
mgnify:CR=1 FL=1